MGPPLLTILSHDKQQTHAKVLHKYCQHIPNRWKPNLPGPTKLAHHRNKAGRSKSCKHYLPLAAAARTSSQGFSWDPWQVDFRQNEKLIYRSITCLHHPLSIFFKPWSQVIYRLFSRKSRNQIISASALSRKLPPPSGGGSFLEDA